MWMCLLSLQLTFHLQNTASKELSLIWFSGVWNFAWLIKIIFIHHRGRILHSIHIRQNNVNAEKGKGLQGWQLQQQTTMRWMYLFNLFWSFSQISITFLYFVVLYVYMDLRALCTKLRKRHCKTRCLHRCCRRRRFYSWLKCEKTKLEKNKAARKYGTRTH